MRRSFLLALLLFAAAGAFAARPGMAPPPARLDGFELGIGEDAAPGLVWHDDLDRAMMTAAGELRPILVLFSSPDCPWCARLKSTTFEDAQVKGTLAHFVLVEIDVSKTPEHAYSFQVRGVPAIVIMAADGRVRGGLDGFVRPEDLLRLAGDALNPNYVRARERGLNEVIAILNRGEVSDEQWPLVLMALGNQQWRREIQEKIAALSPFPREQVARQLRDEHLAVRLGALEIIEEHLGDTFGFDPWLGEESQHPNEEAIENIIAWEGGGGRQSRYSALTDEQLRSYIHDLMSESRGRSARAARMLLHGGDDVADRLASFLAGNPGLADGLANRVREVRYAVIASTLAGIDPAAFARRLVFGNLDTRLNAITTLRGLGHRGVPILVEHLDEPDHIIRETAIDVLCSIGGKRVVEIIAKHLEKETHHEVVFAIVRGLGRAQSPNAIPLLAKFLSNDSEDLAVTAADGLARLKAKAAAKQLGEALDDPRWRVRAAALETIGKLKLSGLREQVLGRLDDPDDFVRFSAVNCVAMVVPNKGEARRRLEEVFLREDTLKGAVVKAFGSLDLSLPPSFTAALEGKSPDIMLAVVGELDSCGESGLELADLLVAHPNLDVACAAIRVLGARGMENQRYRATLANVLRGGDRAKILAALEFMDIKHGQRQATQNISLDFDEIVRIINPGDAAPASAAPEPSGELADLFAAFDEGDTASATAAPPPDTPAPAAAAPGLDLDDLFGAFDDDDNGGGDKKASAAPRGATPAGDWQTLAAAIKNIYDTTDGDDEIKFTAALQLIRFRKTAVLPYLSGTLPERTIAQRSAIAGALGEVDAKTAWPILERLLDDSAASVRSRTINTILESAEKHPAFLDKLLERLNAPEPRIKPAEVLGNYRFNRLLRNSATAPAIRRAALGMLSNDKSPAIHNAGILMLNKTWRPGDTEKLAEMLESNDPFTRRAAYYALGKNDKRLFTEKLAAIVDDPSEHVREVPTAVYNVGNSTWRHYFDIEQYDDEHIHSSSTFFGFGGRSTPRLAPAAREALQTLAMDDSPKIRLAAMFALLSNRVPVDLMELVRTIDAFPDRDSAANRVAEYLVDRHGELGPAFRVLLPYIEGSRYSDDSLVKVRKHFGVDAETPHAEIIHRGGGDQLAATFLEPSSPLPGGLAAPFPVGEICCEPLSGEICCEPLSGEIKLVYFSSVGCSDCARVEALLREIRDSIPAIEVETHDISKIGAMRLNEALCARFNVPDRVRLVTPAVFGGGGFLVGREITLARLGELAFRSAAVPEEDWYEVDEETLRLADAAIGGRYAAMGIGVVFLAGLLDGINPCAFATIIFLLSYLQVAKRKPREILQVGGAFIAAVFLSYFLLGLGMVEALSRLQALRHVTSILNWSMAALALTIMVFSLRDGVLCLRGKLEETTLQLPEFLKRRIHGVVRRGARHSRFVIAAFIAGVVISFLELACTGQVYAPTIMFMLRTGGGTAGATAYLLLYNLAFVMPLVAIFILAYGGMRSESLIVSMRKHAAAVKFATAALFLALAIFLVFGDRLLAGGGQTTLDHSYKSETQEDGA